MLWFNFSLSGKDKVEVETKVDEATLSEVRAKAVSDVIDLAKDRHRKVLSDNIKAELFKKYDIKESKSSIMMSAYEHIEENDLVNAIINEMIDQLEIGDELVLKQSVRGDSNGSNAS